MVKKITIVGTIQYPMVCKNMRQKKIPKLIAFIFFIFPLKYGNKSKGMTNCSN